ncbi:hypothetical protein IZ6_15780 [Terrihabitans soli]|uniref:Uncharacterized protein n=1 Tax=Terrihabitans soli TaxID=708113 RepID=A0A6S6QHZ6_9HYPH|nr:hypothetical protein [Terrihabitans soli]BCJ90843.1 hypothetical protein IZ6_15780 [Terrihabitans soli]
MKLIAALLLVTPAMLTAAYAGSDDTQARAERQRSIYEVVRGDYHNTERMHEGRGMTMDAPHHQKYQPKNTKGY